MQGFHRSLRARPTSGVIDSTRLLLFVCLVAALGGQPVAAWLHVALASHAHAYCPHHHQFEDVPRSRAHAIGAPDRGTDNSAALHQDHRMAQDGHVRCAVLNAAPPAKGSPESAFVLSQPQLCLHVTLCVPELLASETARSVIRLAPKRSPPSVA